MSWSGPVPGAAPYQPQQYPNGQPTHGQQPPYQYGQQPPCGQYPTRPTYPSAAQPQRPPDNRPPKKKGNPIITRYPPPPGYRGPAQPQAPFGTNQYPNQYPPPQPGYPQVTPQSGYQQVAPQPGFPQAAPPAGYPPAAPVPPAYPNQGYSAPAPVQNFPPQAYGPSQPPNYQQQSYLQAQNYQWHQQVYPPNQGYQQAQGHPGGQGYAPPPSNYPGYPPQPAPGNPTQQAYGQAPGWPQSNGQTPYPPNNQYNSYNGPPQPAPNAFDDNATPTPTTAHRVASQPPQVISQPASAIEENSANGKPQLFLAWDDWDFDFEGAIWPKSNEPVDPDLSLGVIIWHPAKQMTRALPSTYNEAESEALKPTPEKLDNGESVSMYFTAENSHEAFLDVRQTDEWEKIRDDPIFVVFTDEEMRRNLVSLEDCIAQRDRPSEYVEEEKRNHDEELPDASWSVMDHLEQVLANVNGAPEPKTLERNIHSPRQPSQEDILAKLGVTGTPKPPSDEPMPMPNPEHDIRAPVWRSEQPAAVSSIYPRSQSPPQKAPASVLSQGSGCGRGSWHDRGFAAQHACGSMSASGNSKPPPPPPPSEAHNYDPWNRPSHNDHRSNGFGGSPAPSDGSNHTMAGSDFEPEKPTSNAEKQTPAVPALERSDSSFSRKRSYEDADAGDEKPRQQDDHSKRKRRSQVDAAYSRR